MGISFEDAVAVGIWALAFGLLMFEGWYGRVDATDELSLGTGAVDGVGGAPSSERPHESARVTEGRVEPERSDGRGAGRALRLPQVRRHASRRRSAHPGGVGKIQRRL